MEIITFQVSIMQLTSTYSMLLYLLICNSLITFNTFDLLYEDKEITLIGIPYANHYAGFFTGVISIFSLHYNINTWGQPNHPQAILNPWEVGVFVPCCSKMYNRAGVHIRSIQIQSSIQGMLIIHDRLYHYSVSYLTSTILASC